MSETHGNPSDHHHAPPAPPEPKTPMWLPALGAVLFLIAGLIWALMPESKHEAGGAPAGSASADAGASAQH
jgi:hypothetical protein